jgi:hypothetical protein
MVWLFFCINLIFEEDEPELLIFFCELISYYVLQWSGNNESKWSNKKGVVTVFYIFCVIVLIFC